MLQQLGDPDTFMSLLALIALEIVLGIDNIVFIAIMVQRVPEESQKFAYRVGLGAALFTRLALLATAAWIATLTGELFSVVGHPITGRGLILLGGGLFLIFKSTQEVFHKVELKDHAPTTSDKSAKLTRIVAQIMVIDIVFSLDSVITAVGIAGDKFWVMATAMIIAVLMMMLFAKAVGDFVNANPSMQILALSFLLLIGVLLLAEGLGTHVSKGYVYFAMVFSLLVEVVNMRRRKKLAKRSAEQAPESPS